MPDNLPIRRVELSRPWIQIGHDPIAIDSDDRVRGGSQNLAQPFGDSVLLTFRRALLLNVAEDKDNSVQLAGIVEDGSAAVIDRYLSALDIRTV